MEILFLINEDGKVFAFSPNTLLHDEGGNNWAFSFFYNIVAACSKEHAKTRPEAVGHQYKKYLEILKSRGYKIQVLNKE